MSDGQADSPWKRLVNRYGKGYSGGFVGLLIWIAICGTYLVGADTPWESSVVRKLEAGKALNDEHVRTIAFWWGAVVNLAGATVIVLATPLWARQVAGLRSEGGRERRRSVDWGVTIGLLLLVAAAAGVLRAPLLDDSFTNDEEMAWRNNGHGNWRQDSDGALRFHHVSWTRTLLTNRAMDNHTLQSAVSRMSNKLWQLSGNRGKGEFSEMAIRMPMFVAGIGSIVLIGILATLVANARVGIGAAVMLALSPWHVRYAAEGRGYSLMIFLMIIALLVSIVAIDRRRLRWWVMFGIFQSAYIYAFPGAGYVAIFHCVVILIAILGQTYEQKAVDVCRLFAAGVFSAMMFFGTQSLAIWQLLGSVKETYGKRAPIGLDWILDTGAHLVAGIPWDSAAQAFHNGMNVKQGWDGQPYYIWVVIVVFPLIALIGLGHMAISDWRARVAVIPVLAGGVLAILHSISLGSTLLSCYIVYLVIPFAICVSWTADHVAPPRTRHFGWFLLLTLGLYVITVAEPLHRIGNYQRHPMLEVIKSVRGQVHHVGSPSEGTLMTATFGTSARQILSYDPLARIPKTESDLEALIAEAAADGKSLVVYFCDSKRAESEWPDLLKRVTESGEFEQKGVFKGMGAMFRYTVYQWKGQARSD